MSVAKVYQGVPGKGVVAAQAQLNINGRKKLAQLISSGSSATGALKQVADSSFDRGFHRRQYAVVTFNDAKGFTGRQNGKYADNIKGVDGEYLYSIQGNILTSEKVLTQAEDGFKQGCDLAERLMNALEQGANNSEGDSRCTSKGRPSDSAFLKVENQDGKVFVEFDVAGGIQPIIDIRRKYTDWRKTNSCS